MESSQILVRNLFSNFLVCILTGFRLYMFDGVYQSTICFFMAYLLFAPANFETKNGRGVGDRGRMGVFVACATIVVENTICLLPRFSVKFFQKNFRPYDIDIIREQVHQGKFKYLDNYEAYVPPKAIVSPASSDAERVSGTQNAVQGRPMSMSESQRPMYPPSEAPTGHTRNPASQNSDGTDATGRSADLPSGQPRHSSPDRARYSLEPPDRPSMDRVRSSFDRPRPSYDKLRPSFEGSRDFTSAALLTRVESSHSHGYSSTATPITPTHTAHLR